MVTLLCYGICIGTSSALDSAESWASIVTAGAAVVGVIAGSTRFLILPLGNHWHIDVKDVKRTGARNDWTYIVRLDVENKSLVPQTILGWWTQVKFPDDVPEEYDPNSPLDIWSTEGALEHYGIPNKVTAYPLATGEVFQDVLLKPREGEPQQICYVEYTLAYRKWSWRFSMIPTRLLEYRSQVLIVPVVPASSEEPPTPPGFFERLVALAKRFIRRWARQ